MKVTANDDLVSLVRCLYLVFNPEASVDVHRTRKELEKIPSFWKQKMEHNPFWNEAQIAGSSAPI